MRERVHCVLERERERERLEDRYDDGKGSRREEVRSSWEWDRKCEAMEVLLSKNAIFGCAEASKLRDRERDWKWKCWRIFCLTLVPPYFLSLSPLRYQLLGGILLIRHVSWLWYLTSLSLIHLAEKCVNLPKISKCYRKSIFATNYKW